MTRDEALAEARKRWPGVGEVFERDAGCYYCACSSLDCPVQPCGKVVVGQVFDQQDESSVVIEGIGKDYEEAFADADNRAKGVHP